jgi:chorismate lyase/3-hydroxybenzoate synthase
MNDQVAFGCVQLEESETQGLEAAAYSAYSRILRFTQELNYPNLLRIWNHFPAVNLEQDGLERYQWFCIGRHQAFLESLADFSRLLPAATTVGTSSGILQVHFLAGKHNGQHIENPRQVSAYHYPRIYGPRSPSFARATLEEIEARKRLFIAGTSSIVSHATQHKGDPLEQTKETLRNLEVLIKHAGIGRTIGIHDLVGEGLLKVYIRNPDDLETVQNTLDTRQTKAPCILYLKGDLCRRGLLVEIEGLLEIL